MINRSSGRAATVAGASTNSGGGDLGCGCRLCSCKYYCDHCFVVTGAAAATVLVVVVAEAAAAAAAAAA